MGILVGISLASTCMVSAWDLVNVIPGNSSTVGFTQQAKLHCLALNKKGVQKSGWMEVCFVEGQRTGLQSWRDGED